VDLQVVDIVVFALFAASVVGIGLWKSRGEKDTSSDYFLAGRGLTWPLIGFSLIAANISAEQMVGMSGAAANGEIGLAIASYEWMAAITLVCVGFFFLPMFLRSGIYTIPQYPRVPVQPDRPDGDVAADGRHAGEREHLAGDLPRRQVPRPLHQHRVGRVRVPLPDRRHRGALLDHRHHRGRLRRRGRAQGVRLGRPHPGRRPDRRRRP
jgi:hypothetical protein